MSSGVHIKGRAALHKHSLRHKFPSCYVYCKANTHEHCSIDCNLSSMWNNHMIFSCATAFGLERTSSVWTTVAAHTALCTFQKMLNIWTPNTIIEEGRAPERWLLEKYFAKFVRIKSTPIRCFFDTQIWFSAVLFIVDFWYWRITKLRCTGAYYNRLHVDA